MVKAILAVKSHIVRNGLLSIVNEFDVFRKIERYTSVDDLMRSVGEGENSVVFLDKEIIKLFLPNCDFEKHTKTRWVYINVGENVSKLPSFINEVISLNESYSSLTNKVKAVLDSFRMKKVSGTKTSSLTERERSILKQIVLGLTNKEISEKLFISPHTVITHRKNITAKLGIKSVSGLTIYALINKIIDLKDAQ